MTVPEAFSKSTVTPDTPFSLLSWIPLPSASNQTKSPIDAVPPALVPPGTSPASTLWSCWPAVSVIGPVMPVVLFALLLIAELLPTPWVEKV